MDFRQKAIIITLLCLVGIPIVSALNICNENLGLELQEPLTAEGEFLGEGLYRFEYGNETLIIKVNNCINCIAENSCVDINNSLYSCGEGGNERCDDEWADCSSELNSCGIGHYGNNCHTSFDTCLDAVMTCEGERVECGLELEEEFNESEYYKDKWNVCVDEKRQYEECGEDENEDCKDLWDGCHQEIIDLKDERDGAEDALNECGDNIDENCKDLWNECDVNYENCKSIRDEYKADYNTKEDEANICKRNNDRLQNSYDTCLDEECPATTARTSCPDEKICIDCSSMLESFKTSISYNTITGGCGGIFPQPQNVGTIQEEECEENKSSLIAWIIAAFMTLVTAYILISNIINLSKIKKHRGGQKPPRGRPPQQEEGAFDEFQ